MTITTLILLLATGIVAVTAVDIQINENKLITSCCELSCFNFTFARGTDTPGVYLLDNFCGYNRIKAAAYCGTSNGGGGWLVVQRRQDGSVDFNRSWGEYEDGFGKLTGVFLCMCFCEYACVYTYVHVCACVCMCVSTCIIT